MAASLEHFRARGNCRNERGRDYEGVGQRRVEIIMKDDLAFEHAERARLAPCWSDMAEPKTWVYATLAQMLGSTPPPRLSSPLDVEQC
jgi:hypothetical protein